MRGDLVRILYDAAKDDADRSVHRRHGDRRELLFAGGAAGARGHLVEGARGAGRRCRAPAHQWGFDALHSVTALRIPDLVTKLAKEDRGGAWKLP